MLQATLHKRAFECPGRPASGLSALPPLISATTALVSTAHPIPCNIHTASNGIKMAKLESLPTEAALHLFEGVPDLHDLISLLRSSDRLREVFDTHFRGLLKAHIIPRISFANPSAVQRALQAVCSKQGLRYCYRVQEAPLPPGSVSYESDDEYGDEVGEGDEKWELDPRQDVWDRDLFQLGRAEGSVAVLRHLIAISADVESILRLVKKGKGRACRRARQYDSTLLEELVWDLQAYTLRCANLQAIEWFGDRSRSKDTVAHALGATMGDFKAGFSQAKGELLLAVLGVTFDVDRHHRRHLLPQPSDSLLFHIVHGGPLNLLRLETFTSERDALRKVVAEAETERPVQIRETDDAAYRKACRDAHLRLAAETSAVGQHPGADYIRWPQHRIARVRAHLAGFLGSRRLSMWAEHNGDITRGIGSYFRDKVDGMQGKTTLEKHIRVIAIDNGRGAKPVDIDAVLPDMAGCMDMAVAKWCEVKSMERRCGIARRVPMPPGLVFSGVAEDPR